MIQLRTYPTVTAALSLVALLIACNGAQSGDADGGEQVTIGHEFVDQRGCATCHQSPNAADGTLSGQTTARPGTMSFGSNLTPDKVTGLGAWADVEIQRATLYGVDNQQMPLCPTMPRYDGSDPMYPVMTDVESNAIIAYLRSLPAISRAIPDSLCPMPDMATESDMTVVAAIDAATQVPDMSVPIDSANSLDAETMSQDANSDGALDTSDAAPSRDQSVKPRCTLLPQTDYPVAGGPGAVVVADFNGDGRPDLASAGQYSNKVSVLLNLGKGAFSANVDYPTGNRPTAFAAADIDGDGHPDLVETDYADNTLGILINKSGAFLSRTTLATGTEPAGLAIVDLDGDGYKELVVANQFSYTLSVFPGKSSGTFGARVDYPASDDPTTVAAMDLDGDGKPDIAVSNLDAASVSVFKNAGGGTLSARVDYHADTFTRSVAVGDLDGDGKPDLISANAVASTVSVFLNLGNGLFGAQTEFTSDAGPAAVVVIDFDGDGHLDVATANQQDGSVDVFMGLGNGKLASPVRYPVGISTLALAAADLDGDGHPDLAVANYGGNAVSVLLGSCQ